MLRSPYREGIFIAALIILASFLNLLTVEEINLWHLIGDGIVAAFGLAVGIYAFYLNWQENRDLKKLPKSLFDYDDR